MAKTSRVRSTFPDKPKPSTPQPTEKPVSRVRINLTGKPKP